MHLATTTAHAYDRAVVEVVQASTNQYYIQGRLAAYKILLEHTWLLFTQVVVTKEREGRSGREVGRCRRLLVRCYDPYADTGFETAAEQELCPYTVQVERRLRQRRKKLVLSKKRKNGAEEGAYNPALHATQLRGGGVEEVVGDWGRPQPYNEKLRKAGREEERMAVAASQVGMVDLLKGKYKKRAVEYPHRSEDSFSLVCSINPGPF